MNPDAEALISLDDGTRWVRMTAPVAVLAAAAPGDVRELIRDAEGAARRGLYAVGWVGYEGGAAFDLRVHAPSREFPVACFALYRAEDVHDAPAPGADGTSYAIAPPEPSWEWPAYARAFETIREHIAAGDSYQVNCTFDLRGGFSGDARGLFADLARTQRGRYAAYLRAGHVSICSASPELFFSRRGRRILTRPMKGTARRGRTLAEDRAAAARLRASAKDRAENVMIVDMMRNDLGRIARTGTVHVPALFAIERYPTVWQMTSAVTAESDAPLEEVFAALFPSASVTGAPKVRTMEIIERLEGRPRGIYTGAIGCVAPGGDAQFSVAIRTAVVDHHRGTLTFGVGSGIVWDSDARAEYRECLLKARVLGGPQPPFELLETMKWTPDRGYALLEEHMVRLRDSAEYFGYPVRTAHVLGALEQAVSGAADGRRIRLLVDEAGRVRTESYPLEDSPAAVRACVAAQAIDADDPFFFHKTTRRDGYAGCQCPDCEDVILWNERGDITESVFGNLIVELDGQLFTPPVASGLLAGTLRARLLAGRRVTERVMTIPDLRRATRVWIVNSVRGWREVELQDH